MRHIFKSAWTINIFTCTMYINVLKTFCIHCVWHALIEWLCNGWSLCIRGKHFFLLVFRFVWPSSLFATTHLTWLLFLSFLTHCTFQFCIHALKVLHVGLRTSVQFLEKKYVLFIATFKRGHRTDGHYLPVGGPTVACVDPMTFCLLYLKAVHLNNALWYC